MVLGNLLGGLGNLGNLGGLFGGQQQQGPQVIGRFQKVLSHDDWWDSALETSSALILATAGLWVPIGRYKVQPRQRAHFGYGSAALPENQGYMYMALYDDTATNSVLEDGKIRLVQVSADQLRKIVAGEWDTSDLRGDANDKNKRVALPEQSQFPYVGEDSYLYLEFCARATDSLTKTAIGTAAGLDIWKIPITLETMG